MPSLKTEQGKGHSWNGLLYTLTTKARSGPTVSKQWVLESPSAYFSPNHCTENLT